MISRVKGFGLPVIIGTGTLGLGLGAIGGYSVPSPTVVPTYQFEAARQNGYTPAVCRASAEDNKVNSAKRQLLVSACAKEREDHRLLTNDLIQQTRAADAAHDQALIAAQSLWLSYMQMIGGFLTLIAAGLAAFYAREAAKETRRSADAAHDDLAHSRQVSELQMRPYIKLTAGELTITQILDETHPNKIALSFGFLNVGVTPAIDLAVKHSINLKFSSGATEVLFDSKDYQLANTLVKDDENHIVTYIYFTDDIKANFDDMDVTIECTGELKYDDIYENTHHHLFELACQDLLSKPDFNLTNETISKKIA